MAVGSGDFPELLPIAGVRIGIAEAGVKYANRKDLVVFELAEGSSVAGTFTKNAFCAAPVVIAKERIRDFRSRYLLINTGNANAGTGPQGMEDARATTAALAELAGVQVETVLPFSTGVIGEPLPANKIINALPKALEALSETEWRSAASGIMTTDTRPKGWSVTVPFAGESITITGISKGAGMIRPNMATMLGFVATDAKIAQSLLESLVFEAVEGSFNRITIDGDTSTNDACILVATGQSDAPEVMESHPEFSVFKAALMDAFLKLAHAIVRDGEGATKFVSVQVEGAANTQEALDVAYTVAHSPLIKTALFASDPNWGRILAAVGRAGLKNLVLDKINIYLDDVCIVESGGRAATYTEEQGQRVMNQAEILIRIVLGRGDVTDTVWTTDLSHDYVTINAEYRS